MLLIGHANIILTWQYFTEIPRYTMSKSYFGIIDRVSLRIPKKCIVGHFLSCHFG